LTDQKWILIADDDPAVLLILRATLERMENGVRIVAVRDGAEALREALAQPFDLVITDVRMPGFDGVELVEAIRASKMNVAVIWITAYGCRNLRAECDRLNIYCCLDKPLRIDKIREAALAALANHTYTRMTEELGENDGTDKENGRDPGGGQL
jgi:DNA-binding NtrC family response regulator